jgi:endonuclease G
MHVTGRWVGSDSKLNQAVPIWSILRVPEVAAIVTRENATIRNSMSVAAVRSGTGETLSGYDPAFLPGIRIALPTSAARLDVLPYTHFSVAMGTDRSLATYAAFQIDRTRTQTVPRSGTDNYTFDTRLSVDRQRGSDLYTANDWDRGHLAFRSAVLWGTPEEAKAAAEQVNTYTNIAPQDKDFNQKTWFALERFVLDQYVPASKRVSVFVGPVFDERDTFYRGAKIPAAFWMVAVAIDPTKPGIPQVKAWMASQYDMKNGLIVVRPGERDIVRRNVVTVAAIEAVTKLTFDPALRSGATPP